MDEEPNPKNFYYDDDDKEQEENEQRDQTSPVWTIKRYPTNL